MKTAVHYAMTPEGDEVWLILTQAEHPEVAHCLDLAVWGELQEAGAGGVAVFSRGALRATRRFTDGAVARAGGAKACPRALAELSRRLAYESDRLRRAETTPESVFVGEARAGVDATPTAQQEA